MLFKEVEAIFTQKVAALIQKGYTINSNTMSGHQGEIAKIDLRKGEEVIRVQMYEEYGFDYEVLFVSVARSTKKIGASRRQTIWNRDLEIIEEMKLFKVDENFFVESEEEIKAIKEKQIERYTRRNASQREELSDAAKMIVLPFVKRQKGMKSCKLNDIDRVQKFFYTSSVQYVVVVKGKNILIH